MNRKQEKGEIKEKSIEKTPDKIKSTWDRDKWNKYKNSGESETESRQIRA